MGTKKLKICRLRKNTLKIVKNLIVVGNLASILMAKFENTKS